MISIFLWSLVIAWLVTVGAGFAWLGIAILRWVLRNELPLDGRERE